MRLRAGTLSARLLPSWRDEFNGTVGEPLLCVEEESNEGVFVRDRREIVVSVSVDDDAVNLTGSRWSSERGVKAAHLSACL